MLTTAKKVLILTDHSNHNDQNSLYAFAMAFKNHSEVSRVDVASRGIIDNQSFFQQQSSQLFGTTVTDHFEFSKEGKMFSEKLFEINSKDYDLIWLRLPPPIELPFAKYLKKIFPNQQILNDPLGIVATGTKSFLSQFSDICPPMKVCKSVEDVMEFRRQYPIVLKPLKGYGGQGIIKIDGDQFYLGNQEISLQQFKEEFQKVKEYLAVKFLKNVDQGDKRIIVIDGKFFGASLRLPASDSWLCNASMGGSSSHVEITLEEKAMIELVDPVLAQYGIVMYGIDTLVNDDGKRVMSELNTTSIGGLPIIAKLTGKPLVVEAVELILRYNIQN